MDSECSFANRPRYCLSTCTLTDVDGNCRPAFVKALRGGEAKPTRGASDNGNASCEIG